MSRLIRVLTLLLVFILPIEVSIALAAPAPQPLTSPNNPGLQGTNDWITYMDTTFGFSLSYPGDWHVFPAYTQGMLPGLGGTAFASFDLENLSSPAIDAALLIISLEATDVPTEKALAEDVRERFGRDYMRITREGRLPNGLEIVEATHEQARIFFLRWEGRIYSLTLPWTNQPPQSDILLKILGTLALGQDPLQVETRGLAAFVAAASAPKPYRPPAPRAEDVPNMLFPWDSTLTVRYTGGPHGSPWDICGQYPWIGYEGIDFGMNLQEVLAVAGGTIATTGYDPAFGNYVTIDHGEGWITHYWHLDSIDPTIVPGLVVAQGWYLGISGRSGSGARNKYHLHLSLRLSGAPYGWHGTVIDGWTVRSDLVQGSTDNGYNYQGTMTQGSESQRSFSECNGQAIVHRGDVATARADVRRGTPLSSTNHKCTAGWPCDPTVNVPISNAAYWEWLPQLVSDDLGGAIIVWGDFRSGTSMVYAQRVDTSGNLLWSPEGIRISALEEGDQSSQMLIRDGSGGAIIAWGLGLDYDDADIYAQRVDADGNLVWGTFGVPITTAPGRSISPKLVSDGLGGAIIVWQDDRNVTLRYDIYAQRVDANGNVLWTTDGVRISTASTVESAQEHYQVMSDGAGGAIITWRDTRGGLWNDDVYAQRVDSSGSVLWTSDGVPISTAPSLQINPQLVSDAIGGAIIAWYDERSGFPGAIYAQRVDASGNMLWASDGIPIVPSTGGYVGVQLIEDGAGGAILTWIGYGDIFAQHVDGDGNILWIADGVVISTQSGLVYNVPHLVNDGAGGAVITWDDWRNGLGNEDIYAQRVDANGNVLWTTDGVRISTASGDQWEPKLVSDGASGAIITWHSWRTDNYDVYAQNLNPNGTLGGLSGDSQ